jgi:hypothetical protein
MPAGPADQDAEANLPYKSSLAIPSKGGIQMDSDLETMSREQLVLEVQRLRAGIRAHRDQSGHDLCWYQPALWSLLPEESVLVPTVPEWPQFMRGCVRYRQSLDEQCPHSARSDEEFGG